MNRYIAATCAYGFGRSITDVVRMEKTLPATKVAASFLCTVSSPVYFPVYMVNDINRLSIHLMGDDPAEYGYQPKKSLYDILYN